MHLKVSKDLVYGSTNHDTGPVLFCYDSSSGLVIIISVVTVIFHSVSRTRSVFVFVATIRNISLCLTMKMKKFSLSDMVALKMPRNSRTRSILRRGMSIDKVRCSP